MLTLRTSSPFDLFDRLDQQLSSAERVPPAEVHETDDAYEVVLELPGVDKAAIDVKATDRTLVISAERRNHRQLVSAVEGDAEASPAAGAEAKGQADARTHGHANGKGRREPLMTEFRYGTWSRSFRFPTGIDREHLEARYRDGLLTVKAPKAQRMTTVSVKVDA